MINSYIETALWSSVSDNGEPLDRIDADIAPETLERFQKDLDAFTERCGNLLDDLDSGQVAHDFWLTRNYHGAGFWDRGLNSLGEKLTDIAHKYGEYDLFIDNAAHE